MDRARPRARRFGFEPTRNRAGRFSFEPCLPKGGEVGFRTMLALRWGGPILNRYRLRAWTFGLNFVCPRAGRSYLELCPL